jgi:3-oxoacyl-[acyl-carrier-protein] synthase-3
MTAIVAVSSHLPATVTLADVQDELGLSDRKVAFMRRYFGLAEICRTDEREVDLLVAAANGLDPCGAWRERVRYVVRARTVPVTAPYPASPLTEVRDALGLAHATAFTVNEHACATGLLAVDVCGTLLAADGDQDALALILTGEKAFTPMTRMIQDVALMGEGTAAVLVAAGGERDRLLGYATRTHGGADGAVILDEDGAAEFRRIYAGALAEVVHAALAEAKLTAADVDLVLPHNVNRISWARVAEALGVPLDRIFLDNVARTGHCFCADTFINHRTATGAGVLRAGDVYVMVSVGLGSVFSAMVFRH